MNVRICDYLHDYSSPLRFIEIAAADKTGLSRRRFNDLFKKQYGVTPGHYITNLKIEAAKSLLVDNGLSIQKIALLCGFDDHYYFCKVFKEQTGVTPTQFRKGQTLK